MKRVVIFSGLNHPITDATIAQRHDWYASAVSRKSDGQIELYSIATRYSGIPDYKLDFLKLIDCGPRESFLQLSFFSLVWAHKLKKSEIPMVISSPDPFVLGFLVIYLRKFLRGTTKVQIQCHGDFGDKNWRRFTLKHFVLSKLAQLVLKKADQIRCVGPSQSEKIIASFKIDSAKIVIAPVPTKDKEMLPLWDKPITPVVAFLGRLHKERSVDIWAEAAKEIYLINNNVHFLIIGDGPERKNFEDNLLPIPSSKISFSGKVPNEKALALLSKSSVLLSTALFDSYGMAMVEAAKMGLPIVSKPTSGALDLSSGYNSMFLGGTPKELAELTWAALGQGESGVITGSQFLRSEAECVSAVVDSWLELI